MTDPEQMLARRQQRLLVRSSELRNDFALHAQVLRQPLALADQVHSAWRWLRAHPELPLAAVGVVLLLRPRRSLGLLWRLGWRLVAGWRLWQRVQGRLAPLLATTRR